MDCFYRERHDQLLMSCTQIQDKASHLEASHHELKEIWEQRKEEFEQNLDIQMFRRDAEQAEAWIALREAFLGNEDLGVREGGGG